MLVKRENSYSHLQVIDHRRESSSHEGLQGAIWLGCTSEQVRPNQPRQCLSFHLSRTQARDFLVYFPQYLVLGINPCTVKTFQGEPRPMQSLMVAPKFAPKPQIAFLSCLHLSVQYHHLPICSGHSLGILLSFSYRLAQLFNNPDSSNSKLYSQSDSLHNSNT